MNERALKINKALTDLILRTNSKGAVLCIFGQDEKAELFAAIDDSARLNMDDALLTMAMEVEKQQCKIEKEHIDLSEASKAPSQGTSANN